MILETTYVSVFPTARIKFLKTERLVRPELYCKCQGEPQLLLKPVRNLVGKTEGNRQPVRPSNLWKDIIKVTLKKGKFKLSFCLIKHHIVKAYVGVGV
jgi:hypothetical protein